MSRIPIVNPNRFYTNKEIDLVSLLPNNMKETEIETFLRVFETYLNEMYEATTKYIPPENLESIPYTHEIIWTNNYNYITGPYGDFLNHFKVGDFVKRNNENNYYKIGEVIDNSTIKLTEVYINASPSYLKSAYWDEFGEEEFTSFWYWTGTSGLSPEGCDSTVPNRYTIDKSENRIYCTDESLSTSGSNESIIATKIYGDYQFEFGFQRNKHTVYRNRKFGFSISPDGSDGSYQIYYENGFLNLSISSSSGLITSGYIETEPTEDSWVVNLARTQSTGKINVKVSSLKKKSGSIPLVFTSGVGFFNRFNYEIDVSAVSWDGYDKNQTLKLINGYQQAWNYVYFESDLGFPGEADTLDLVSELTELPESKYIYGTQMGRVFENDGDINTYQFYHNNGLLRIRDLTTPFSFSATDFRSALNHISILEKIHRLTELHDPDLIDIDFIQYYSDYLGYDVNINRETMSVFLSKDDPLWDTYTDEEKQKLQDDYLRFTITNLPTWYKIKTTDNALTMMLYSFGLISELNYYFCTNYGDKSTWTTVISGSDVSVTTQQYQTPHFSILLDLDTSNIEVIQDSQKMKAIIDAILSVKPINTVFRGLGGYFKRTFEDIYVNLIMYSNAYYYIK